MIYRNNNKKRRRPNARRSSAASLMRWSAACLLLLAVLFIASGGSSGALTTSAAGNIVDGRIDPAEYSSTQQIVSPGPCTASNPCGTIHFNSTKDTVYVAFEYNANDGGPDGVAGGGDDPVINENVFGPSIDYHDVYQTGWNQHKFTQLLRSDALETTLYCSPTGVFDFDNADFDWAQDYLNPTGDPRGCRQNSLVQSTSALIWQMARKEADLLA